MKEGFSTIATLPPVPPKNRRELLIVLALAALVITVFLASRMAGSVYASLIPDLDIPDGLFFPDKGDSNFDSTAGRVLYTQGDWEAYYPLVQAMLAHWHALDNTSIAVSLPDTLTQ